MPGQQEGDPFCVHTSILFDPKKRAFVENVSIKVDPVSGSILDVFQRTEDSNGAEMGSGDVDLRGLVTMPGLVDAHTHVFLHSYE
jgi:imidazolonepropionase-like amidohydrolase